jgi:putative membrane protein
MAGAVVVLTASPAVGQVLADPARTPDAAFVAKAADAAGVDAELASIAVQRAAAPDVKTLARRLRDGRKTIARDLAAMAGTRQIAGPSRPTSSKPATALRAQPRAAFDSAFLTMLVANGEAAVALFEAEARDGRDDEIKEWAARQLPALREQLTATRALRSREGAPRRSAKRPSTERDP